MFGIIKVKFMLPSHIVQLFLNVSQQSVGQWDLWISFDSQLKTFAYFISFSLLFFLFRFTGIVGFVGALGMGAYNYKNRGNMSTSMYLMQLRVVAQGTVVGALCLGMMYSIGNRLLAMYKKDDKPSDVAHH